MSKYIVTTVLGLCLAVPGYAQSENEKPSDQAGAQRQQGQRQQGQRQQARGQQGGPSGPNDAPIAVKVASAFSAALRRNNGKTDLAVKDLEEKLKQNPEGISDPAGKAALLKALSDMKKAGPAGHNKVLDGIFAEADKAGGRQQDRRPQGQAGARGQQSRRPQGQAGARGQQSRRPQGQAGARGQQGRRGEQSGPRTPPRVFVALRGVFGDEPDRDKGLAPSAILQGLMKLDENKDGKLSPNELMQPSKPE